MTTKRALALVALGLGLTNATQAAEQDAHAAHAGHPRPAETAVPTPPAPEHAGRAHHQPAPATPPAPADHSSHSGHGDAAHTPAMPPPASHAAPLPMHGGAPDHAGRAHEHRPAESEAAAGAASPVPPLTEADRAAAFPDLPPHAMHRGGINTFVLADRLEWQGADEASALAWDLHGWVGGDLDRLAFRTEGERLAGHTEDAELQLLWSHAIGPWWESVAGVRQDFQPGAPQTWAAVGVQGSPLYGLETEATAFLGEGGQSAARLSAEYDLLLTNRLILQPLAEVNLYGRDDAARGIGAGLGSTEVGVRLRYEIRREFAPYLGVSWTHAHGRTADQRRADDEAVAEARWVAGVRFWF